MFIDTKYWGDGGTPLVPFWVSGTVHCKISKMNSSYQHDKSYGCKVLFPISKNVQEMATDPSGVAGLSTFILCVLFLTKKISEQPCSNGEPMRYTVLWISTDCRKRVPSNCRIRFRFSTFLSFRTIKSRACTKWGLYQDVHLLVQKLRKSRQSKSNSEIRRDTFSTIWNNSRSPMVTSHGHDRAFTLCVDDPAKQNLMYTWKWSSWIQR
jgi:hypothetical protein